MQDNDFERVQDFLRFFESENSFNQFCFSLSKKRIQNMTTDEWISFFYGLKHLSKSLRCKTTDKVVMMHSKALAYMYSNFRFNKAEASNIKHLAYKMADALATSKAFADFYYATDVRASKMPYLAYKSVVKKMRTTLYNEVMGDGIKHSILKPKVKTSLSKNDSTNVFKQSGCFEQSGILVREVDVHPYLSGFCNTAAHELYHSIQHLSDSKRAKLLKKLGFELGIPFDGKIAELYSLNSNFYINASQNMQGYKKQPLEYGARFFATCFERRLRHNLKSAENNWGITYMSNQLMRTLGIFEDELHSDKAATILSYSNLQEKETSLLQELSDKYLKNCNDPIFLNAAKIGLLCIESNSHNIININRLYTKIKKAENDNNIESAFIKQYFPITYYKYYASDKEKLAYKPVISKVIINRLDKSNSKT